MIAMKSSSPIAWIAASVLALSVPTLIWSQQAAGGGPEWRTWTNKAGTKIEATLIGVNPNTGDVEIELRDGRRFKVPMANLSEADAAYATLKASHPPAAPGATPAAPATPTPGAPAAKPSAPAAPVGKPAPAHPGFKMLPLKGFKGPSGSDFIGSVQKVRPRLLETAQTFASLKAQVAVDPNLNKLLTNLKASGDALLQQPELTRVYGESRGGTTSEGSQAIYRFATLGVLHYADGDPKWKERAVRELVALTDFPDWKPAEPEITADFLIAASIGFDWFLDGLNAEQRKKAREFMVQKGIDALVAHLKGDPIPETAKGKSPGQSDTKSTPAPAKAKAGKDDKKMPPTREEMAICSALILAGICLVDEEPAAAKKAVEAVGKTFSEGMELFAPGGVWPEGLDLGDQVLDYAVMVMQTLRVSCGGDFGLSVLEGIPQAGLARLHLVGPTGQAFNFGESRSASLSRPWVSTWLAGMHGNVGTPAVSPGAPQGPQTSFFGHAGNFLYYNPYAAGYGQPASFDAVFPGAEVAALRSAWNDRKAYYLALKGGDNEVLSSQLDLGSFILEAGGVRWAVELGAEEDRVSGSKPNAADRSKRHALYLNSTAGQNTLIIGAGEAPSDDDNKKKGAKGAPVAPAIPGNQPLDAKATVIASVSLPDRGVAVVDLTDAYSSKAKTARRGAMMVRGAKPYALLQDDLEIKNNTSVEWNMHTTATIEVAGNKATLTQGEKGKGQTLTAVLLSPPGAQFSTAEPPEQKEPARNLSNYHILRVKLNGVKGEQRITVAFALGDEVPTAPVVPIAEWIPKK